MKKLHMKKVTALATAFALGVTALAAGIGYTLAAKEMTWQAEKPPNAPINTNFIKELDTKTFASAVVGGNSWITSDRNMATVAGNNPATVTMLKTGMFTLAIGSKNGAVTANNYLIQDSREPASYVITKNQSNLKKQDDTDTIPITVKDAKNKVLADKVTWTSDNESVATVAEKTGVITAVAKTGIANIRGQFTDMYGQKQQIHYPAIVGQFSESDLIGPDGNGDYFKPTGDENVYEKVDGDGNSKTPPEFIYDENGNMSDGSKPDGDEQKLTPITDPMKKTIPSAEAFDNTKPGWLTDDEKKAYEDAVQNAKDQNIKPGPDDKYYKPIGDGVWQGVTVDPTTGQFNNVDPENFVGGTTKDPKPYMPLYQIVAPTDTTGSNPSANDYSKKYPNFLTDYGDGSEKAEWDAAKAAIESGLKGPDANGNYYKPLTPDGIYEVVNNKGEGTTPPRYVYDKDGNPADGNAKPAIKGDNGTYYVEEPKNIFTPVDQNGNLNDAGKVWGGNDAKPGTADDKPAIVVNGQAYADMGENIFAPVSAFNGKLGTLVGAGKDEDPTTTPATPIFDNTAKDGHYYYGPFTDTSGTPYYIGDKQGGAGNGLIDTDNKDNIDATDTIYYKNEDGTMSTDKPATGTPVTGITLGTESDSIRKGTSQEAPTVTITPTDATNKGVTWSSSDNSIATVDAATGKVTAVGPGKVVITATASDGSGVKATYELTVFDSISSDDIDTSSKAILGGKTWDILDVDDKQGKMLIMTSTNDFAMSFLDNQFSNGAWGASKIRTHLNGKYLDTTFTSKEKAAISVTTNQNPLPSHAVAWGEQYLPVKADTSPTKDKIFCLSELEVVKYLRYGYHFGRQNRGGWTTRTLSICTGDVGEYNRIIADDNLLLDDWGVASTSHGVRPAMWVDMTKLEKNWQGNIVIKE